MLNLNKLSWGGGKKLAQRAGSEENSNFADKVENYYKCVFRSWKWTGSMSL